MLTSILPFQDAQPQSSHSRGSIGIEPSARTSSDESITLQQIQDLWEGVYGGQYSALDCSECLAHHVQHHPFTAAGWPCPPSTPVPCGLTPELWQGLHTLCSFNGSQLIASWTHTGNIRANRSEELPLLQERIRKFREYLFKISSITPAPFKTLILDLYKKVGKRMKDRRPYLCHSRKENPGRPCLTKKPQP